MSKTLIRNGLVYLDGHFSQADVLCENGRIAEIGCIFPSGEERVVNAAGLKVVPGFIDLHTHGAANQDVNAADADGLRRIAAFFASQGTTAFLASVLTDTAEVTERCLGTAREVMADRPSGARLLGVHLEGPFLAKEYKGAMPEHLLRKGDTDLVRGWLDRYPGVVRYITVSPEVDGVIDMIREISGQVVVAIGHSGATYASATEAIRAGATCVTHTFNAMRLFHQHEPAIMGAALESDCYCEAICDGRHLAPGTVRMLLKCKGYDRVMAVTDSIMAAGLPDGEYMLGVNRVVVTDGDARLADSGVRAGSTLTTANALRNLIRFTEQPLEKVLPLLTANPADALRIGGRKGRVGIGMDADLVLLDNRNEVRETIVAGETVYRRG